MKDKDVAANLAKALRLAGYAANSGGWQPIATAPKDGTRILLLFPSGKVICGQWDDDHYRVRPRPYWANDLSYLFGLTTTRRDQPTYWQSLPDTSGLLQCEG